MFSTMLRRWVGAAVTAATVALTAGALAPAGAAGTHALRDRCPTGECDDPTNSFTSGTLVLMADGSHQPIGDVHAGDQVAATDPSAGVTAAQPVLAQIPGAGRKDLVEVTVEGGVVTATANHLFWVVNQGRWQPAAELRPGDQLVSAEAATVAVTAVRRDTRPATVANLDVAGPHTYYLYVGGRDLLVHS